MVDRILRFEQGDLSWKLMVTLISQRPHLLGVLDLLNIDATSPPMFSIQQHNAALQVNFSFPSQHVILIPLMY